MQLMTLQPSLSTVAAADADDDGPAEQAARQPLPLDVELRTAVLKMSVSSVAALVALVDTACIKEGYKKLHQKLLRKFKAYYHCGCGDSTCFKLTIDISKKGAVQRCCVVSVGDRLCEPNKPFATALAHFFSV